MKCPLCDMRFCSKRKSQYYRHYKTVHLKMREFECDFCNKKFSRGEHKKRHILRNCKLAKQFVDGLETTPSSVDARSASLDTSNLSLNTSTVSSNLSLNASSVALDNPETEDCAEGEETWASMLQL